MPPEASKSDSPENLQAAKVRRILFLAFGGLLALMFVAGFDALSSLRKLDGIERQVNQRYSAHNQALTTILISVHVYHDQMERYLIQGDPSPVNQGAADVKSRGDEVQLAIQKFPPDADAEEKAMLADIRQKILEQENSFALVVMAQAQGIPPDRLQIVLEQMMLRRAYILQISRNVALWNDRKLVESTQLLAANFQGLQSRLVSMVGLSLLAGLLLSLIGGFYILRLEKQGRTRFQELVTSQQQLEALSARLVDAQEEERRSISRELHDEVGQTLGALLVDIGQLSKLVPAEDGILQSQIARIKSAGETAVKSIRDMALLLRPPMLDDLGLVPALEWQGREISRRGDMEVDVHSAHVSDELTDEVKVCIYRLVQEALNNAARHSAARHARVSITQEAGKIHVEVEDDGKGFASERVRGMGILGMEERVKRLGGTLTIQSKPGAGTTVVAELPSDRPGSA
ncbi:MAG: sensor histidine kinase [Candidatus Acidiferrum sp.]